MSGIFCSSRGGPSTAFRGKELTLAAHKTFDSRLTAATSRQHSVQAWFALRERQGKVH